MRKWVQEKFLFRNDGCVKWLSFPGSRAMIITMMVMMMMMLMMMVMMVMMMTIAVGAVKSNVV